MIIEWGMETQESIRAWAEENFGPANDAYRVLGRAFEELVEAMKAISELQTMPIICKERTWIAEELADVVITLAGRLPFDLIEAVKNISSGTIHSPKSDIAMAAQSLGGAMVIAGDELGYSVLAIADCVALLWAVGHKLGFNVADAVDAKMTTNRMRKWNRRPDGTGYHVKEA